MKNYLKLLVFLLAGAFLAQGFQCASPEMTTAKVAYQYKDWEKAETSLVNELAKNPQNEEAITLLVEVKQYLGKFDEAADLLLEKEKYVKSPNFKNNLMILKINIWGGLYNNGIIYFQKYYEAADLVNLNIGNLDTEKAEIVKKRYLNMFNDLGINIGSIGDTSNLNNIKEKYSKLYNIKLSKKLLEKSINYFNYSEKLKPDYLETYRIKGIEYLELSDTNNAILQFTKYTQIMGNDVEFAKNNSIFLNLNRNEAIKNFGKPLVERGYKSDGGDSLITDYFLIDKKELYLYSKSNDNTNFNVIGWIYNPSKALSDNEKLTPSILNTTPYEELAQIYFNRAEYDKSLQFVQALTSLEPENIDFTNFLFHIYDIQNKKDEALKHINDLIRKNPNNKYYLFQFGNISFKLDSLDAAIQSYEKAVNIDPNYCDANYNLAVCYKKKALHFQTQEFAKSDKNPKYKINLDEFYVYLKKSTSCYEKVINCENYSENSEVLGDLANNYYVLENKEKFNELIDKLESMSQTISENKKVNYYLTMCKIFSTLKMTEKTQKYCDEAEKLIKEGK